MRLLLVSVVLLLLSTDGRACGCFPPEARAKTAQEALHLARVAVYGRVVEVGPNGVAKVLVLESFKGYAPGSTFEALPASSECKASPFSVKEEALILSFGETVTACDKHPPEHYLLEVFRSNAAKETKQR
jgi:hypothetical protein